jgi:hypothetical protein
MTTARVFVDGVLMDEWGDDGEAASRNANALALRDRAAQALAANAAFLAADAPTNAQAVGQVQRLTRQVDALIRLVLGDFGSTDGT